MYLVIVHKYILNIPKCIWKNLEAPLLVQSLYLIISNVLVLKYRVEELLFPLLLHVSPRLSLHVFLLMSFPFTRPFTSSFAFPSTPPPPSHISHMFLHHPIHLSLHMSLHVPLQSFYSVVSVLTLQICA